MTRPLVKTLLFLSGALVLAALILALVFWLGMRGLVQAVGAVFGPPEGETRVEMLTPEQLAEGGYALILGDFVTGSGPRLIDDPDALARLQPQLWYLDERDAGSFAAAAMGTLMGMNPTREIGALMRDGVTLRRFSCRAVLCQTWPAEGAQAAKWGLGALRGAAPGRAVEYVTGYYDTHESYLAAHARVLEDPDRWFAEAGGEIPAPPDSGLRAVHVDFAGELAAKPPPAGWAPDPLPERTALVLHAIGWIGDSGGRIASVRATPMPLWVMKDGTFLHDGNGSRALPDLTLMERGLVLEIPHTRLEEVLARIDAGLIPPPDRLVLGDALHRAFAAWGLETDCLPGCGAVDEGRIIWRGSAVPGARPQWRIESWRPLPDE